MNRPGQWIMPSRMDPRFGAPLSARASQAGYYPSPEDLLTPSVSQISLLSSHSQTGAEPRPAPLSTDLGLQRKVVSRKIVSANESVREEAELSPRAAPPNQLPTAEKHPIDSSKPFPFSRDSSRTNLLPTPLGAARPAEALPSPLAFKKNNLGQSNQIPGSGSPTLANRSPLKAVETPERKANDSLNASLPSPHLTIVNGMLVAQIQVVPSTNVSISSRAQESQKAVTRVQAQTTPLENNMLISPLVSRQSTLGQEQESRTLSRPPSQFSTPQSSKQSMIERETFARAPQELSPTSKANPVPPQSLPPYNNSIEIPALNLAGLNVFSAAQALSSTSPIEYPELSSVRPIYLPSNPTVDPSKF